MYSTLYYIAYKISLTSSTCILSFAKEFGHPDWQGYGSFITRWTKRYGIVNKAICGSKESAAPMMNWIPGRKLFSSPPLPGTHQTTFTMGMKLPCFTSHCLTGLTALMVTSLQALQNVKTDLHCLSSPI